VVRGFCTSLVLFFLVALFLEFEFALGFGVVLALSELLLLLLIPSFFFLVFLEVELELLGAAGDVIPSNPFKARVASSVDIELNWVQFNTIELYCIVLN